MPPDARSSSRGLLAALSLVFSLLLVAVLAAACSPTPPPPTPPSPTPPPPATAGAATRTPTSPAPIPASTPVPSGALAPTALSSDTVIKLSWPPVPGARGYQVYRDGSATPLNATPLMDPAYEDLGLTNGRSYSYTVAAVDSTGQPGPRSPETRATPRSR